MTMILIVEDEQKLAELLKDYLAQSSFDTTILDNGNDVIPYVRENKPDLVILDLMLPGRDGMEICKEIRTFSNLPIIMVTARVEEIDRLLGLELGADDYVCKPFSPRELVARVKAVLRRAGGETTIKAKGLVLDEARYQASLHGVDLELTAVEFKLLSFLAANPGRIYSRDQLMERIYSDHRIVSDRTIDSHIKKLRKKIAEQSPDEELIGSVYGVGYKFI
ncbi:MAG: response regulator [Desulfobulbaceae bacterium]|jgi:two-component system, OmpR family, response regulator BaeR|nr:response regulator [Desulfobulbaceae bacterium]MDH3776835.1 response regulator [Desulfobulbaceae bacterium]MDH3781730.1 response regulator [Desulfobulbaceae bacterium]MDH3867256.1 response regulator [Desulfobulbaceae bacterium]MDH3922153.1 response regulator [Desulfobulbaceae bacterium]